MRETAPKKTFFKANYYQLMLMIQKQLFDVVVSSDSGMNLNAIASTDIKSRSQ
jgi:hypothetical protein